jgi:hypothetical protein
VTTPSETFKQDKYVLFENVLSPDICNLLTNYMFLKRNAGYLEPPVDQGGEDNQCPKSWSIYGDPMFDTILAQLSAPLSNLLGIPLLPAYTYSRIYQPGEVLEWHLDRPSCEISGTMTLGASNPEAIWPIYVGEPGSTEKVGFPMNIRIGELMMYSGCEVPHWRDEFTGEWQVQVFYHYIRADGPYAQDHIHDGRHTLGVFKDSREYDKQLKRIIEASKKPVAATTEKKIFNKSTRKEPLKPFKFEL